MGFYVRLGLRIAGPFTVDELNARLRQGEMDGNWRATSDTGAPREIIEQSSPEKWVHLSEIQGVAIAPPPKRSRSEQYEIDKLKVVQKRHARWAGFFFALTFAPLLGLFIAIQNAGRGEAGYFYAMGMMTLGFYASPILLIFLVSGIVFAVKASRATSRMEALLNR